MTSTRFDAFLSYCRDDQERVQSAQLALEQINVRVWRDTGQIAPGDIWIKKIEAGLRESNCVVLFNSRAALASEWVQREWNVALALNKRIVPVRLDDADVPLLLITTECIDFHDRSQLPATVQQIASGIRGDANTPSSPKSEVLPNPSVIGQDVTILERMIHNEWNNRRSLALARLSVATFGALAFGGLISFGVTTQATWMMATLGFASLAIPGVIVWVITALLRSSQSKSKRLTSIKDGIELYCPMQQPCLAFRTALENILKEGAGIQEVLR